MKKLIVLGAVGLLGGCHGSGSGSSTNGPTMGNFTSFSAVQPNQTVTIQGMSTVVTGTVSGGMVTPVTTPAVDTASSRATMTYDATRTLAAVSAITPGGSISFSKGAGDKFTCNSGVCGLTNMAGTASMIIIEPITLPLGWNYQTFGVWDRATSATSFDAGVFSVGNPTPGSAIPAAGMGAFVGLANGFFVDAAQHAFFTTANMTANANFSAQTIAFTTTNTHTVNLSTPSGAGVANPGLDLSGTFTYSAGTNLFGGVVNNANNNMSGPATGRFYGPTAQEIGGVYNLTGAGGSMMGSFGGKR